MSAIIISAVSGVLAASAGALVTSAVNARASRAERRENLEFRSINHHYAWEPVDEETRSRLPGSVGPGALRLTWQAELSNRGHEKVTVRAWRWWPRDLWERSYYYPPLESATTLVRVGAEEVGKPLEEGDAFAIPAGDFVALRLEGLFVVLPGEREGGPEGCAPRLAVSFRGARDYLETGEEPLTRKERLALAAVEAWSFVLRR